MYGGRWNPKGIRMLYTSQSLSLAILETIVNLSSHKMPNNLYCVELDFPNHLVVQIQKNLPAGWNSFPYTKDTMDIGRSFISSGSLCLKVPSAVVPTEYNYLLNPLHDDFMQVKFLDARPIILDKRLV